MHVAIRIFSNTFNLFWKTFLTLWGALKYWDLLRKKIRLGFFKGSREGNPGDNPYAILMTILNWRHYVTTELRHYDTTALRHYSTTALWHYGTKAQRPYDTTALRHYGTTALRHYDTTALRHYSTTALQHYGIKEESKKNKKEKNSKISGATYISDVAFFIQTPRDQYLIVQNCKLTDILSESFFSSNLIPSDI